DALGAEQPSRTQHPPDAPADLPTIQLTISSGDAQLWVGGIWCAKREALDLFVLVIFDPTQPDRLAKHLALAERIHRILSARGAIGPARYSIPRWFRGRRRLSSEDVQRLVTGRAGTP